jgi:hypothetical protein
MNAIPEEIRMMWLKICRAKGVSYKNLTRLIFIPDSLGIFQMKNSANTGA